MKDIATVAVRDYSGLPVRMVQFGGGNFLRGFLDWMLDLANEKGFFNGSVVVVKPTPSKRPSAIEAQRGRYTVLRRGRDNGWQTACRRLITTLRGELNPYNDWAGFLSLASEPQLRFVSSNTTESGIAYTQVPYPQADAVPASFPAKLTALLHTRFTTFRGAVDKGLVIIPCELIENNGGLLKELVLRHARDWSLEAGFAEWIELACVFCNTLVDSIVPGFPAAESEALFAEFGYEDKLLVAAEVFNLLVIQAPDAVRRELPLEATGAQVIWTDDIAPYRERKVRVLNGAHTSCVLAAYLAGLDTVREMLEDADAGALIRKAVFDEILPALALAQEQKQAFAHAVLERFANPYIRHELLSISLNSTAKWKVRVLPSLKDFLKTQGKLPAALVFSWAALCCFYRIRPVNEGDAGQGARSPDGSAAPEPSAGAATYPVKDSSEALAFFAELWATKAGDLPELVRAALGNTALWGEDLSALPGLSDLATKQVRAICERGARAAIREVLAS